MTQIFGGHYGSHIRFSRWRHLIVFFSISLPLDDKRSRFKWRNIHYSWQGDSWYQSKICKHDQRSFYGLLDIFTLVPNKNSPKQAPLQPENYKKREPKTVQKMGFEGNESGQLAIFIYRSMILIKKWRHQISLVIFYLRCLSAVKSQDTILRQGCSVLVSARVEWDTLALPPNPLLEKNENHARIFFISILSHSTPFHQGVTQHRLIFCSHSDISQIPQS